MIKKLFSRKNGTKVRTETGGKPAEAVGYPDELSDFWYQVISAASHPGGQVVNEDTARKVSAVYACEQAIMESVAMLPVGVYEQQSDKKSARVETHFLSDLLRKAPNPWQDSFEFREQMQGILLSCGNSYAYKRRLRSGAIDRLVPLQPDCMRVAMGQNERIQYVYKNPATKTEETYDQDEIFHLKYRSQDGILGRSPMKIAAEPFGVALALQTHALKVFENGAFLSGLLETDHTFKDNEQRKRFLDSFKDVMGAKNSGKWGLLENGVKYKPHQQNARDAQLVELCQFSVIEIARIYRMPPHMIQELAKGMSFASVEQMAIIFVQYTIQPWITRWEAAIKRQLLTRPEDKNLYVKFNEKALLRGDLESRTKAIVEQLKHGLATINEGRHLLDANPTEEEIGDKILIEHNMIPADQALQGETSTGAVTVKTTAKEPDPQEEKSGDFEPLFADLIGRFIRKEQKAIDNALKKDGFYSWAEDFYKKHETTIRETLEPACKAFSRGSEVGLKGFIALYLNYRADELLSFDESRKGIDPDPHKWVRILTSMLRKADEYQERFTPNHD